MHERVSWLIQVLRIRVPLALPCPADLHHELPGLRELQNLIVLLAIAAYPHEAFRIHVDTVLRIRPLVPLARSSPRLNEVACGVELQQRRGGPVLLFWTQRSRTLQHPHVILLVNRHAGDLPELPVVGNLRPCRIHAEHRHSGGDRRAVLCPAHNGQRRYHDKCSDDVPHKHLSW